MKTKVKLRRTVPRVGAVLLTVGILLFSQCSKDDEITPLSSTTSTGSDVINTTDGTWSLDKSHSNVNWKTAYYGDNAWLTGKFNKFGIDLNFDEANPTATTIEAWVQLSTFNTGEPGRDGTGKCGSGYMGVDWTGSAGDTLADGSKDPAFYDPATDFAWFNSTSVSVYGDGYLAKGDFTFRGVTKTVDLYFNYIGQVDYSDEQDGSKIKGGLTGEFEFLALSDFGVSSTSIADKIKITIGANYKKN